MKISIQNLILRITYLLKWAFLITMVIFSAKYCFEAKSRFGADVALKGWWVETSDYPDAQYLAKQIFVSREKILLRLYRVGDPTLLAERMYRNNGVKLFWTKNELIYDSSDDSYLGGGIQLPPTRLDSFLAKLP